jgi:predicted ATPase with chaperone activity
MLVSVATQVEGVAVHVDVDLAPTEKEKVIVLGYPENLAPELISRAEQAILSHGFRVPTGRVVVSFSPAIETSSSELDKALADALLMASGQLPRLMPSQDDR